MKHLAGQPRHTTCLTMDECRGCPNNRPQRVNTAKHKLTPTRTLKWATLRFIRGFFLLGSLITSDLISKSFKLQSDRNFKCMAMADDNCMKTDALVTVYVTQAGICEL
jgi:hypothetical protein